MCFLNIEFKFLKKIYEIKQIDVNDADKIQETDLVCEKVIPSFFSSSST